MGLSPAPPPNLSETERRLWFRAIGVLYGNCHNRIAYDKRLPIIASLDSAQAEIKSKKGS
jgi:hypothetical protein